METLKAPDTADGEMTHIAKSVVIKGELSCSEELYIDGQVAKALRLPMGDPGGSGSPYFSLVYLIKRWSEGPVPREILMLSDGIDRFGGSGPSNPYVDSATEEAQRAGIVIHSIYTPVWPTLATVSGARIGARTIFPRFPTRPEENPTT